jgi:hypothetical protein
MSIVSSRMNSQEDKLRRDVRRDDLDVTAFHELLSALRVHFSEAAAPPSLPVAYVTVVRRVGLHVGLGSTKATPLDLLRPA